MSDARERMARALYAQWQKDSAPYWRAEIEWSDLCALADEGASGHQEMVAKVLNGADAALAVARELVADVVTPAPEDDPKYDFAPFDAGYNAARASALSALGGEP